MSIDNYVTNNDVQSSYTPNGKTVLLDLWGVVLDQEKAGKVMVDAYRKQATSDGVPAETIDSVVSDYNKVLQNDKSVADRKGDIVNALQDPAEEYIEKSDDPDISESLEESIYADSVSVISRAKSEGYNVAVFTTKSAEWIREYIKEQLGEIYDAPEGKTAQRFDEIYRNEARSGREVVSFTEDASKALMAAQKADYVIGSLIYINRGDNGLSREECEENGIVYAENLEDVYNHVVAQEGVEEGAEKVEHGRSKAEGGNDEKESESDCENNRCDNGECDSGNENYEATDAAEGGEASE